MRMPAYLWLPQDDYAQTYAADAEAGQTALAGLRVAFVGLARNCAGPLAHNLGLAELVGSAAAAWSLHVETNDNTDDTDQVLVEFCRSRPHATFHSQRLGREQYGAEFAGRRTIALAEYRAACQRWVRENASETAYVIAVDWDAWGGFNVQGLLTGIAWLERMPEAYGMASVSLAQASVMGIVDGEPVIQPHWTHYDAWALRGVGQRGCTFDDYRAGTGGWKHHWLPPVGSSPALVTSAFGGCCIYRTADYLAGTYDGETDCEHVPFHVSIAERTGRSLYLCPGMRTVMTWMQEAEDAVDSVPAVPSGTA